MARFYVNCELAPNKIITLPETVTKHIQVLRLQINSKIELFNGNGCSYLCIINDIMRKNTTITVLQHLPNTNTNISNIDIGLCIIANDKMDLALQKAAELGVQNITPIISERSQKFIIDKQEKRLEHWQKVIINSCEQCGQNYLPKINSPLRFKQFIDSSNVYDLKFILSPHNSSNTFSNKNAKHVLAIIGPEGGFSPKEVDYALNNSFLSLKLGDLILRAETAVMASICYLNLKLGNWKF